MQQKRFLKSAERIPPRLGRLKWSSITELKKQWRELHGSEPPRRISRELLIPHPGTSLRRAEAVDPKTPDSPRQ